MNYYGMILRHSIMMTGNFTSENTIIKVLPFSSFNCCYHYIVLQESRAVAGNPRDAAVIFDP